MEKIIKIATEYTKTPGGRFVSEGKFSGEAFRNNILLPAFLQAQKCGDILTVDLDGGYGYATSFLEESFGGLVRVTKDEAVKSIKIISEEEPALIQKITDYIDDALAQVRL